MAPGLRLTAFAARAWSSRAVVPAISVPTRRALRFFDVDEDLPLQHVLIIRGDVSVQLHLGNHGALRRAERHTSTRKEELKLPNTALQTP